MADRIPLIRKILGSGTHSDKTFVETIAKLNAFPQYEFVQAYQTESTHAYHSGKARTACWLKRYDEDELADRLAAEMADYKSPVFRYGNWVGYCLNGDTEELATKVRYILIGAGEWKE